MECTPDRYPLLCFDLDDTLITGNTWYRLNTALGISPEQDLALYTAYHAGELSYADWTATLQSLYRPDATKADLTAVFNHYTLAPGASAAVADAKSKGYTLAIITGSFIEAATAVGAELDIPYVYGVTHCTYDESDTFTGLVSGGEEHVAKLDLLIKLCQQLHISPEQCIAVGDSENDIPIFKAVGQAITFTQASKAVRGKADMHIDSLADLIAIL